MPIPLAEESVSPPCAHPLELRLSRMLRPDASPRARPEPISQRALPEASEHHAQQASDERRRDCHGRTNPHRPTRPHRHVTCRMWIAALPSEHGRISTRTSRRQPMPSPSRGMGPATTTTITSWRESSLAEAPPPSPIRPSRVPEASTHDRIVGSPASRRRTHRAGAITRPFAPPSSLQPDHAANQRRRLDWGHPVRIRPPWSALARRAFPPSLVPLPKVLAQRPPSVQSTWPLQRPPAPYRRMLTTDHWEAKWNGSNTIRGWSPELPAPHSLVHRHSQPSMNASTRSSARVRCQSYRMASMLLCSRNSAWVPLPTMPPRPLHRNTQSESVRQRRCHGRAQAVADVIESS
jgi:hypothetical protein